MSVAKIDNDNNYLKDVRAQYEQYPYPPRDPALEVEQTRVTSSETLAEINYYHFGGKHDFSKGFRALIAGGGTGDSAIFLAHQLRDNDKAEIVYLDISEASMNVAKERAKVKGLTNIAWEQGSLLDIGGKLDFGKFDYINCSGVLHHLEDPEAGLKALASALNEGGVLYLMLYATYGRTAIYQLQELMRRINKDEPNMQKKVDNCKEVLKNLPAMNWFRESSKLFSSDVDNYGDVGIYDLLLHSQDRSYTVDEIYDYAESADLKVSKFFYQNSVYGDAVYGIGNYIKDPELLKEIQARPLREQQAMAELMHSKIRKHVVSLQKEPRAPIDISDLDFVVVPNADLLSGMGFKGIVRIFEEQKPVKLNLDFGSVDLLFKTTPELTRVMQLIDGKRSMNDIFDQVIEEAKEGQKKPTKAELLQLLVPVYLSLENYHLVSLVHKSVVHSV